jgi:hypothetical protein
MADNMFRYFEKFYGNAKLHLAKRERCNKRHNSYYETTLISEVLHYDLYYWNMCQPETKVWESYYLTIKVHLKGYEKPPRTLKQIYKNGQYQMRATFVNEKSKST